MAVIIGDIHGNLKKTKAFLAYKPEVEHIALGDYFDSFTVGSFTQIDCFKMLLDSDCVLLWGNHDLHYLKNKPFCCSGYQSDPNINRLIMHLIEGNKRRLLAAYVVDDYICTHAGISEKLIDKKWDIRKVERYLNGQMKRFINAPKDNSKSPIFNIGRSRGGWDDFGGIFWFDFKREYGLEQGFKQIFGHTEVHIPLHGNNYWAIDVTNSDEIWVMDTELGYFKRLPYLEDNTANAVHNTL